MKIYELTYAPDKKSVREDTTVEIPYVSLFAIVTMTMVSVGHLWDDHSALIEKKAVYRAINMKRTYLNNGGAHSAPTFPATTYFF